MTRKFLILIVGCPSCGAKRGENCKMTGPLVSPHGTEYPHKARVDLYKAHKQLSVGRRA